MLPLLLKLQATYYVITGVWPLISLRTFEWVTGPKVDDWLVQMVGLLAATIGVALWVGAREKQPAFAIVLLAVLSAVSFAFIDIRYALVGRISAIYLADAVVEVALALALTLAWRREMS
jgi:energy-converting hydrogenase Eha subunit E